VSAHIWQFPGVRTYETSRTRAKHEDVGSQLGSNLLQTVARAGSGLEEGGVDPVQVMDLEHLGSGIGAVFGEAAIHGDAVGIELHAMMSTGRGLPLGDGQLTFSHSSNWPRRQ